MTCPILLRWFLHRHALNTSYFRMIVGTLLAFVAFQLEQQTLPYASTSLTCLSNLGNLQIFLIYFGAIILLLDTESEELRATLGWAMLLASMIASATSVSLQWTSGNCKAEVEQSLLEYNAREAEWMLSTQELRGTVERMQAPYEDRDHGCHAVCGDETHATLEQLSTQSIRKGIFMHASDNIEWVVPEGSTQGLRGTRKDSTARASFPCYGACDSMCFCQSCRGNLSLSSVA